MACQINRTKDGKINSVTTPSGAKSELFDSIHGNIFLADADTSVKILTNAYSEKAMKMFEGADKYVYKSGEPQLFYKSESGVEYSNLEELIIGEDPGNISMGFKNPNNDSFQEIAKITNKGSEKNEFLTAKVKEGLLSAERVLGKDGVTRFQGKGVFTTSKIGTAVMVAEDLKFETGNGRVEVLDNGTIEIEFSNGYSQVIDKDGNSQVIRTETIPEVLEKNPDATNKVDLAIEYTTKHDNPRPLTEKSKPTKKNSADIKGITKSLNAFLKSMGFTTTTLEAYRKNYNTKYGKDPDIQALTDIANKVVAFREGKIPIEDLSEEVAHIAIEAFSDQNSIVSAMANVHLTPEYTQHAEYYRQKYAPHYEGVELEDQVRREVLGKILKNEFVNRFNTENKTAEQVYLIQKLRDIWRSFTTRIRNAIKGYHRTSLDKLNKRIADSVLSDNLEDFQTDLTNVENFYYSAMSNKGRSVEDELQIAKKHIEDFFRSALKDPTPNQAELDKLIETNGELDILSSINTVVDIAQVQMDILEINAKEAASKSELMSMKDTHRYEVLKNSIIPTINNLKQHLKTIEFADKNNESRSESILKAGDEVAVKMANVEPLIDKDKLQYVDEMVDRVTKNMSLTEEQTQELRDSIEGGYKDIGWLGKMFGLSSQSKNPVLQLLHMAVMKVEAAVTRQFITKYNPLITEIEKKGLRKYQKSIIMKDKDGNATHYLISPRDYAKYDNELAQLENGLISEITGESVEEIERLRGSYNVSEIIKDTAKYSEYKDTVKEWKESVGSERRFNDKYYAQRDARFEKAGVSKETQSYLSNKNTGKYSRRRKYLNADGTIDLSKQTKAEKVEDRNDFKQHLQVKSAYDTAGNLKPGLRVLTAEQAIKEGIELPFTIDADFIGDIITTIPGKTAEALAEESIESRRALDLFNLDMLYREELKDESRTNKPVQKFMDKIEKLEADGQIAYEWMISNASLGLSSDFYDNLGTSITFKEVAQDWVSAIEDPTIKREKQLELDGLIRAQRSRKNLLKQNRKADSTIEYDVNHMTTQTRERLLELDSEIAEATRTLGVPFELVEQDEDGGLIGAETSLNSDFYDMLTEFGGESKTFDFALNHMSRRNSVMVEDFAIQIEDYINGKRSYVKPHFDRFIGKVASSGKLDGKTDKQIIETLKNEYAKEKVASYFKRFQPEGYTEGIQALKDGEISVSEFMNNKEEIVAKYPGLAHLEVSPEYSWSEDVNNEDMMNTSYKAEGMRHQPKVTDKNGKPGGFLNDVFFTKYGIKKADYLALEDEDISKLTPTKNKEEYEFLVMMTNMREEAQINYGDSDVMNKYSRVQLSRDKVEKWLNIYKGAGSNVKDMFTDLAKSKMDEKEYGEEVEGTGINVKTIPKYFQNKLEDPSIVTENTLYASMLDLKESIRYKERVDAERDVKALEHKIAHQTFKNGGGKGSKGRILKSGEVSNYYAKAQEMADYHLYGIRQNRRIVQEIWGKEVDFTQWFQAITKYARNVNLAFNFIADATSYTTGVYNNLIDKASGDYYHKSSAIRASKIISNPKTIGSYVAESGQVKKTTEFSHLLEFFGVEDIEEKLKESASGRAVRLASKSFFGVSKVANLPVTPKNMYAVMFDFKYDNGRFKSFNDFARDMRIENKDISKKAIDEAWRKNNDTFYDNIEIDKNTGVSMNDKFKDKYGQNATEEFEELHTRMMAKITHINQNVDSIISKGDQIAAQRDALTNALLLHRGWFIINMTRKFKGRHANLATGQIESGHYMSIYNSAKDYLKSLRKGELKAWRNSVEEHEMRNLRRFGADAVGIILLTVLTNMLLAADDDDDTAIENFAQLIALRTSSESQSQNVIGMAGTIADVYKQPIVQLSLATNMSKTMDKVYKDGEFTWENSNYALKNILLYRRPDQLSDLQKQVDSYMHFNSSTLWGIDAVGKKK